ncbi:hypothetical protein ACROYT_G024816 [Oculina patagonica]
MMKEIGTAAKLSKVYTNHCVWATAMTLWSEAGLSDRHICHISGYRNPNSRQHYNSRPSSTQLRKCSDVLSSAHALQDDNQKSSRSDNPVSEPQTALIVHRPTRPFTAKCLAACLILAPKISSSAIQNLSAKLFLNLTNLDTLILSSNSIRLLQDRLFVGNTKMRKLDLSSNSITSVSQAAFTSLTNLQWLYLSSNSITFVSPATLLPLKHLSLLDLSHNKIRQVPRNLFCCLKNLATLLLRNNMITFIANETFTSSAIELLDVSYNKIHYLPETFFCCLKSLKYLQETFAYSTKLRYIIMSDNRLESIPTGTFHNMYQPQQQQYSFDRKRIMLTDNPIKKVEPEAFRLVNGTLTVYLIRTKLKILSIESFIGFHGLDSRLMIKNRSIGTLRFHVNGTIRGTIYLNYINSNTEVVKVHEPTTMENAAFISALLSSGFKRIPDDRTDYNYHKFLPCPLGTFSNSSSKGAGGCIECPPGGFYSDDLGYVAKGCKKCPTGSFVPFDKAPGIKTSDCKTCPEGTDTDFFAGYRACQCLEGFYRTHMFENCHKCGQGGLKCKYEYASLNTGFWWEWRNETHKDRYRDYIANLLTPSPALDVSSVQFSYQIPIPYMCQTEESCLGGLDSPCKDGYEGPICAVCSLGHYKQLQTCTRCPSKQWVVGQLSIIVVTGALIIAIMVWKSSRKRKKCGESSLLDMFFSKLKIVIGFYQVTHGLLEAFSYIK